MNEACNLVKSILTETMGDAGINLNIRIRKIDLKHKPTPT
jgi:hypothetical protein